MIKKKLFQNKDSKNAQKATDSHVGHLKDYLHCQNKSLIKDIADDNLSNILFNFYSSTKPTNGETYSIETLKCISVGLNRFFKKYRNIDITQDCHFIQENKMFRSVTVNAKGKEVVKTMKPITPCDFQTITEYFRHYYMNNPHPKKLRRTLLFYIIYYFCRHGRENLKNGKRLV